MKHIIQQTSSAAAMGESFSRLLQLLLLGTVEIPEGPA
jgi:hypothetical protein